MTTTNLKKAQEKIRSWRENPAQFVNEELKVETIDEWQKEALDAFPSQDPQKLRISLQACTGPGKSAVLSWFGWNFLACYGDKGDHPKGAAVSITGDNLKDNLWAEFSRYQTRSEYLMRAFQWTKERIFAKDHPETWFISARSFAKSANAEEQGRTLSGLHSGYVLALIDESGDIPPAVGKAAEQILSSQYRWAKIAQAGNPTSHTGMLYAAATSMRHLWYVIRITGDPDDPKRSPRINLERAKEQIALHGRDNPWVMATILGEFPPTSLNALLSPDEVENAMRKHYTEDKFVMAQRRIGVDVARFGDDRTVLFPRQGLVAFKPVIMRNARTNDIAARLIAAKASFASEVEFIDDSGGWGAGVIDSMITGGYSPMPVNFSGKAIDPRYFNKRSEIWWEMAEWVKRGGALPPIPELVRELTAPTYTLDKGKLRIEEKDQIKERIQCSPDLADALALTFALPEQPAATVYIPELGQVKITRQEEKTLCEWDPFKEEVGAS